jgi:spermidine synthase
MPAVKSAKLKPKNKSGNSESSTPEIDQMKSVRFDGKLIVIALLLFLSGTAALIYQLLWIRQLSIVVGVEVYSITIAVGSFFAGLAAGSAVLGRIADRWRRPFLLYALLEGGVAVFGVTTTVALAHTAGLFTVVQEHAGMLAWLCPFLLVGSPAFLMGGTLPVALRAMGLESSQVAEAGGWFYAANTIGGIAGAILSTFVFLPWLGVRGTGLAAALLNLAAAGIAVVIDRRTVPLSGEVPIVRPEKSSTPFVKQRTAFVLYAITGGIALGYEVVWSQSMAQFLSTRVFAFSIVLATYLAGLAIGSLLYARFAHRVQDPWGLFGLLICAIGFIALFEISLLGFWQLDIQIHAGTLAYRVTGSELIRMCVHFLVAALGIVFVPTILLGAAFPAALRMTAGAERVGQRVGAVLAWNTAGGIVGTLLTGFVLIPALGLVRTLAVLAIGAASVGTLAVLLGAQVSTKMQWSVCLLGLAIVAGGVLAQPDRLAKLLLTTRGGGQLVFYEEGRGATVAVAEQRSGDNEFRRLFIQGISNSGDAMPSLRYMRLQAMLPLMLHRGEPKSALVIGFGTGITAGAILHYPHLQRRVCVELLPAVVKAGSLFPENYKADSDPRLQIRIRDGRQELLRSSERYDLITLEPPPPSEKGIANLYSTDFYQLASRRLEPDGLFAQWLPLATQNEEDTRALVRSFLNVFPYATIWTTELHEMLLIGSHTPIEIDATQITDRFLQEGVSTSLQSVGVSTPAALMATWVTGREGLERYAANVKPVTDDNPSIEYAPWVRPREITRTLPHLLALRTDPPLLHADESLRYAIRGERDTLLDFYTAGIAAYDGDRQAWGEAIQRVQAKDPDNAYYRWIIGRN